MRDTGDMRRYRDGEGLPTADGRNIDPEVGRLLGEGSQQRVKEVFAHPAPRELERIPSDAIERADEGPSYYGVPTLKEPVWRWYIPAYFYVGGVAGAAAALGAAAQVATGRGSPHRGWFLLPRRATPSPTRLVGRCRLIATAGAGASAALLIADLGRPMRFLNMLRVFRPTSPMNMGTWILSGFGAMCGLATLPHLLPSGPRLRRAGDLAAVAAGALGLPLCTYTGVLVANTAVPVWQGARRGLPVLFGASGAAGAASLLELWSPGGYGERVVHRFALMGKALEVTLSLVLEGEVAAVPRVARPLRRGASGAMWRAAQACAAGGLIASLIPGRAARRTAGVLGTMGSLLLRFAVMQAGRASARDPHATFQQQRAGRGAADVVARQEGDRGTPALDRLGLGVGEGLEQASGHQG